MFSLPVLAVLLAKAFSGLASPSQQPFDLQGHRGGRGNANENTLHSFAWGMIDGVKTLELDNGITKDGVVVVWHDMHIPPEKCEDTSPAFPGDPDFPYVGKQIANLTLAQIKTLDCGSERLVDYPMQLVYPRTKISTLQEVFDFVACADPERRMLFNIESKVDAVTPNNTRSVDDFVTLQHAVFLKSGYDLKNIIYQSFDWRTLIGMKALEPKIPTAALISSDTAGNVNGTSPWLAGLQLGNFPDATDGAKIASAAKSIKADILSPSAVSGKSPVPDPTQAGYIRFTTKDMVDRAHELKMTVIPWTVDRLNIADELLDWGVDGIITDYPTQMRRRFEQRGLRVPPRYSKGKVFECLAKHAQ
ncbi:putative PLC-like phosphodiesterase [Lyophyllum shimeji]|uniref:PLC-like phosphodiesterase n=1 Tax=Lyophyllum shimeji TaxID=47721 RepID=A0A9P3PHY6_LYOSH|nr:putative PLC-like phosphodiesterase [Lyophyllum shimeji]